ncbi:MAG: hypothetical protein NVS4B2_28560 [Chloroflexota bacterium]
MQRRFIVLTLISTLLAGAVSPVAASQVHAATDHSHVAVVHTHARAAAFNKTRFLAHLAVAAFLVHYIYKKYKAGKLGRTHKATDVKAAAAALLAYHEMQKASGIANASHSKPLLTLLAPMVALLGTLPIMASKLKSGDTGQVSSVNNYENSLQSTAGQNGYSYTDRKPSGFSGF